MKEKFEIRIPRIRICNIYLESDMVNLLKEKTFNWIKEFIKVFSNISMPVENNSVKFNIYWDDWAEGSKNTFIYPILFTEANEEAEVCDSKEITLKGYVNSKYSQTKREYYIISGTIEHDLKDNFTSELLRIVFFHIWRCANISYPGMVDFYGAEIIVNKQNEGKMKLSNDEVSYLFHEYKEASNIPIQIIDISKTWAWYLKVVDTTKYYTVNKFDRAITGLFNYLRHDGIIQAYIVDLFLGIEAFYSLGGSDIINKLKNRCILFLEVHQDKKTFKRRLNDFYQYRSRYVHGDKSILVYADVLENTFLSEDTQKLYDEFFDVTKFAIYFLMLSIQKAVIENRYDLEFIEEIKDI